MPTKLDRNKVRTYLKEFNLRILFTEELGWDHGGVDTVIDVGEQSFALEAVAHKRGMVAFQFVSDSETAFPEHATRRKIEKAVAKKVREHIIVYATHDRTEHSWQWVKREPGQPDRHRSESFRKEDTGERLIQKLEHLVFTMAEEEDLTIVDVSGRVRAAFDVEKVTKRFYDRFKKEQQDFLGFIEGIGERADREWYASLMLNRMMFIYFIQKRGFLDSDTDYLRNRLEMVRQKFGNGRYNRFYRLFMLRLFHEGLGQPEANRAPKLAALLGRVPFLNGGLFDVHDLEKDNKKIQIPDEAFERIFDFFDAYTWHLDDRPLRNDNEINPDVLGYIFEKYINQKQMGAYYTKEDITGYISRNTVIPFLFDRAKKACSIAFKPDGAVWRLLQDDPDRYFYEAVRHGITYEFRKNEAVAQKRDLPQDVAAGMDDVSKRDGWNKPAPPDFALPTETWREHVARRHHFDEVYAKLASGEVTAINDLITYNLDIEKFAQDVIAGTEGPELIRAFWKAITGVSVLDPTCGSGAFLFAALNILEPIYTACLEAMRGLLDDLARSRRPNRPEMMKDFRQILGQVESHPSERYFILKSIIINNLYGVDIMEEAVEICKLRLFLKLVAQLENVEQIEPLPDIDFNIRAGNTLVGFTSLDDVRRAVKGDLFKEQSLPDIEERAEMADRSFRLFQEMQTERAMDASAFANAKLDLRGRLDDLRDQLNQYLAGEYGVRIKDRTSYEQWCASHQPFHWFVQFYGIVQRGGFDVVIGNPPYVEYGTVKGTYSVNGFITRRCGNLYAMTWERSIHLGPNGHLGLIVPASATCTDRYEPLRKMLLGSGSLAISHFSDNPGKLFQELPHNRLSIILLNNAAKSRTLFSTTYNKWRPAERGILFQRLAFADISSTSMTAALAKLGRKLETSILQKFNDRPLIAANFAAGYEKPCIYYTRKLSHFVQILNFIPEIYDTSGQLREPSELKRVIFSDQVIRDAALGLLNSSLFYWLITLLSDCRNLNKREIEIARFDPSNDRTVLLQLATTARTLMSDIAANSRIRKQGSLMIQETYPRKSKEIIDKLDSILAKHYGMTDEELDFIINYDIKYRMGF